MSLHLIVRKQNFGFKRDIGDLYDRERIEAFIKKRDA